MNLKPPVHFSNPTDTELTCNLYKFVSLSMSSRSAVPHCINSGSGISIGSTIIIVGFLPRGLGTVLTLTLS